MDTVPAPAIRRSDRIRILNTDTWSWIRPDGFGWILFWILVISGSFWRIHINNAVRVTYLGYLMLNLCPHLVVLHISILTPVSFPPLCGRNQTRSMVFEAAFETCHCSCIFHFTGNQVPIVNDSVGEKVPSNLQPSFLLFCSYSEDYDWSVYPE